MLNNILMNIDIILNVKILTFELYLPIIKFLKTKNMKNLIWVMLLAMVGFVACGEETPAEETQEAMEEQTPAVSAATTETATMITNDLVAIEEKLDAKADALGEASDDVSKAAVESIKTLKDEIQQLKDSVNNATDETIADIKARFDAIKASADTLTM